MKRIIKWICIGLTVLILAFLALLLTRYNVRQEALANHMEDLKAQADAYERELLDIRLELEEREEAASTVYDCGSVLIGYSISQKDDLEQANGILVLDCADGEELLTAAKETGREIILTCSSFDKGQIVTAKKLTDSNAFLLIPKLDIENNHQALRGLGFTVIVRYLSYTKAVLADDSTAQFPYQSVKTETYDLETRLQELEEQHEAQLFLIDCTLSKTVLDSFLETVQVYVENGSLQYETVEEMEQIIREAETVRQERQAEYDTYYIKQQARIDRLNNLIQNIYRDWSDIPDSALDDNPISVLFGKE